jgi:hypothetical protein
LLTGTEVLVKRADIYSVSMRAMRVDQIHGWFYTLHFAKFSEPVEEQPIPAADVQNAFPLACWPHLPKPVDDQFGARTPPPVFLEKFTICFAVFWVHQGPFRSLLESVRSR